MASSQGSGSAAAFLVLVVTSVLAASALGKTIQVPWNQQTDYNSWAQTQTFNSGDELVFNFDSSHTCVQVSQTDYSSCSGSNQLKSYSSGQAIKLTSDAYFICTVPGHCQTGGQGMALAVKLSSTPATPTTPSTPGTPTPTTPGTPTTPTTPTTPETPSTPASPSGSGSAGLTAGTLLAASAAIAPFLL